MFKFLILALISFKKMLSDNRGFAAVTGTLVKGTEFSGRKKMIYVTASIGSASDTVTLTQAAHGLSSIDFVIPILTAGQDVALNHVEASASGLVITVTSEIAAGTPATDWTGATVGVLVVGSQ